MDTPERLQGRLIYPHDIEQIKSLIKAHPDWNRTRLSRELCKLWDWKDPAGRLKDMACRTFLLKLHRRDSIILPRSMRSSNNHLRSRAFQPILHATVPIEEPLAHLRPIRLVLADKGYWQELWNTLISLYHYKGFRTRVGHSISYLALDRYDRVVGCFLFGAAAWKIASRDAFVGWSHSQRQAGLTHIANNMRFLVPPWVRVPHLASHLLGLATRQLPRDWLKKYGFPIWLLETFVDLSRFQGLCYQAANWQRVGQTTGRTRNNPSHRPWEARKAIYLYPLKKNFRQLLSQKESP